MKNTDSYKANEEKKDKFQRKDDYSESAASFRKEAIKITAIYLLFGFLWILASDEFVKIFIEDRNVLFKISVFKGLVYVLVTGALIYFLINKYLRKIQRRQMLLMSVLNSIPDLIFHKDSDGVYRGCNKAFEQFVGRERSEIIGHTDYDLFDREVADLFRKMDVAMVNQKSERKNEEYVPYPDGHMVYLETLKTPYYDTEGNVLGLIGVSRDITERKNKEEEIFYLNKTDVLTGLYNRRFFEEEKIRVDAAEQLPLSVIFADVNGLKLVNDSFGYSAGDAMLFETGKMIKKHCRANDVIARIGGDEFCILLPKTEIKTTKEIIEKMQEYCETFPIEIGNATFKLSVSFGHSVKNLSEETLSDIIKLAEDAMRRSKLLNRNSTRSDLMASIKATMLEKSHETAEHTDRMANWAKKIGKELNFPDSLLFELELAANLHDIGKMSVQDQILSKDSKLTEEEWLEIRKHPEVGYRIAQSTNELLPIAEYILAHHERWDGKGYPQGLAGEKIPLISRIISIVDAYDAMIEDRTYRSAMSKQEAMDEILKNAGTQFDPDLAKLFIEKIILKENANL